MIGSINYVRRKFWNRCCKKQNGCWEWTSTIHGKGYGQVLINKKRYFAHRISWELTYGSIPAGLYVLHKCDNRRCINPDHLFLGTLNDNTQDMVKKGRQPDGERHPNHKMTNTDVRKARVLYDKGFISQKKLAVRFGVSQATIWRVLTLRSWKRV